MVKARLPTCSDARMRRCSRGSRWCGLPRPGRRRGPRAAVGTRHPPTRHRRLSPSRLAPRTAPVRVAQSNTGHDLRLGSHGCVPLASAAPVSLDGTVWAMSYSTDLTDEQWALLAPVFNAPGKRGPKHAPDLRTVVDAMLYGAHRLSVAIPPRVVRAVDPGVVAVPPLVSQRHVGESAHGAARCRPRGGRSRRRDAVDGGHRHPPRSRVVQRRGNVPRPRRPLRPHQGRQAGRCGRRDRAAGGCFGRCLPLPTRTGPAS